MAFTPTNYLTAQRALDQIATDATSFDANATRAVEQIVAAAASLSAMTAQWTPAVQYINAQASANPADLQWQETKARMDKYIADFQAMRARAIAIRDAAQAAG